MGKGKKYSYEDGGKTKGGQALFDAMKKKGYKRHGGETMLSIMTKGGMMDMSDPAVLKVRSGGSMVEPKIKMVGGSVYGKKKK